MAHESSRIGPEELLAHASGLRRLAVRLVGDSSADDLVQETLLAGLERPPLRAESTWPWLAQVMRNIATMRWRADTRRERRERNVAREEADASIDDWVARMELQRIVAEEVLNLPDPYRATVLAFYFDGVRADEHARLRGVPAATVRSQLKRGIEMLRVRLDARAGNDREGWHAALVALARPDSAMITSGTTIGVLVVNKILVGLAALLLVALGFWFFSKSASPAEAPVKLASTVDETKSAEKAETSSSEATAQVESSRSALASSVVANAAQSVATGTVEGVVTMSDDGSRAANIGVSLCSTRNVAWSVPPQQITNEQGEFKFVDVAPGDYELQLDRVNPPAGTRVEAGQTAHVSMRLPHQPEIQGKVLDENGVPVSDAEVWLVDPNRRGRRILTKSNIDGKFTVANAGNQSSLFAHKVGYQGGVQSCGMFSGTLYLIHGAGRVTGTVKDRSGAAIANAVVKARLALYATGTDPAGNSMGALQCGPVSTGVDGSFVLDSLSPGSNSISVDAQGFASWNGHIDITANDSRAAEIVLAPAASLDVFVTDEKGEALPDVSLHLERSSSPTAFETVYGRGQHVVFDALEVGEYEGWVRASGHEFLREHVRVESGGSCWKPVMRRLIPMRGRVVDAEGRPLEDHFVYSRPPMELREGAQTNAGGWFEFASCSNRPYTLYVSPSKKSRSVLGYWTDVQPTAPDIELRVGAHAPIRLAAKFVDEQGTALSGLRIWVDDLGATTDDEGRVAIEGLVSGHARLGLLRLNRIPEAITELDLHEGESRDLGTLVIPNTGSLFVRVHGVDPSSLAWTDVRLLAVDRFEYENLGVKREGRAAFRFSNARAGDYYLKFTGGSIARSNIAVHIDAGREGVCDVTLELGTFVRIVASASRASSPGFVTFDVRDSRGAFVDRLGKRRELDQSDTYDTLLAPGSYTVDVADDQGLKGHASFEVRNDRVNDCVVVVPLK